MVPYKYLCEEKDCDHPTRSFQRGRLLVYHQYNRHGIKNPVPGAKTKKHHVKQIQQLEASFKKYAEEKAAEEKEKAKKLAAAAGIPLPSSQASDTTEILTQVCDHVEC